jgi:hypothetical protein
MREVLVRRVVGMAIRRRIASGHGDLKLRHPLIPQNSQWHVCFGPKPEAPATTKQPCGSGGIDV